MCGICGVYKDSGLTEKDGIDFEEIFVRCESRGRDAFGYYTYPKKELYKQKGCISEFLKGQRLSTVFMGNKVVMAHTRQSTTGPEEYNPNNHPFETKDFVLAHNGCIWNDDNIREKHKFDTDIKTDSVVILKLIQEKYDGHGNVAKAIVETAEEISGSFACWLMCKKTGSVYLFRHNNPIYAAYSSQRKMFFVGSQFEFFNGMTAEMEEVKGFIKSLDYAPIEEGVVYRLTKQGIEPVGKFKGRDNYSSCYVNGRWQDTFGEDEEETPVNEVTNYNELEKEVWDCFQFPITEITKVLGNYGYLVHFGADKIAVKLIDPASMGYDIGFLRDSGYTVSPKTGRFTMGYDSFTDFLYCLNEMYGMMW